MDFQTIVYIFSIAFGWIPLVIGITKHRKVAMVSGAAFMAICGIIVIIGYIFQAPQVYTFPKGETSVALPTGVNMLMAGLLFLGLINEVEFKNKK